jgi:hypothetical protein
VLSGCCRRCRETWATKRGRCRRLTKADLLAGRELADIGQCCPTSFTTGNLANFLRDQSDKIGKENVAKKFALEACDRDRLSSFRGFDWIETQNYRTTTSEKTICRWCPVSCKRAFIDVKLPGAKGRPWSKDTLSTLIVHDLLQTWSANHPCNQQFHHPERLAAIGMRDASVAALCSSLATWRPADSPPHLFR